MNINVVLSYLIGGAYTGLLRLAASLPQYNWVFTTTPIQANVVIYANDHAHYIAAKKIEVPHIIQRKTGVRSFGVVEPEDLSAVVCASREAFNNSQHPNKVLIYNGVCVDNVKPIASDLLVAERRICQGQQVERSIQYAIQHRRQLTVLGDAGHSLENTYNMLQKKYPRVNWVGAVTPNVALQYIKGANDIIVANPSHGVANQIIEAVQCGTGIIDLTGTLEIPNKRYTKLTAMRNKYLKLFHNLFYQGKE